MKTIIPYDEVKFVFVTSHYDIHLAGICEYEGKMAKFETYDETDYVKMHNDCPYCSGEDTSEKSFAENCECENYVDLFCYISPLTMRERIRARISKQWFEFCIGYRCSYDGKRKQIRKRSARLMHFYYFSKRPTWRGFKQVLTGKNIPQK